LFHACNRKPYKKTERDQKVDAAKASIRVEPLNVRHDRVIREELTRKPYLTISEACLVLNVRVKAFRRWIKKGIIKTNRVGKKHLIDRKALIQK
jgi:excisionase family DNA binding protein